MFCCTDSGFLLSSSEACLFLFQPAIQLLSDHLELVHTCFLCFVKMNLWKAESAKSLQVDKTQCLYSIPQAYCQCLVLCMLAVTFMPYSQDMVFLSSQQDAQIVHKGLMKSVHSGMARPSATTLLQVLFQSYSLSSKPLPAHFSAQPWATHKKPPSVLLTPNSCPLHRCPFPQISDTACLNSRLLSSWLSSIASHTLLRPSILHWVQAVITRQPEAHLISVSILSRSIILHCLLVTAQKQLPESFIQESQSSTIYSSVI